MSPLLPHIVHKKDHTQFRILESNMNRLSPILTQLVGQKTHSREKGVSQCKTSPIKISLGFETDANCLSTNSKIITKKVEGSNSPSPPTLAVRKKIRTSILESNANRL